MKMDSSAPTATKPLSSNSSSNVSQKMPVVSKQPAVLLSPNLKLIMYTIGIYSVFIIWGVIQEKLTSAPYALTKRGTSSLWNTSPLGKEAIWNYPIMLNVFMALSAYLLSAAGDFLFPNPSTLIKSSSDSNKDSNSSSRGGGGSSNISNTFDKNRNSDGRNSISDSNSMTEETKLDSRDHVEVKRFSSHFRIPGQFVDEQSNTHVEFKEINDPVTGCVTMNFDVASLKAAVPEEKKVSQKTVSPAAKVGEGADEPSQSFRDLMVSFWRPALTCALASPIGYSSLNYISYPLMVLAKSSKPVPVMLVGFVYYKQRYSWDKVFSVLLICMGVSAYSLLKTSKASKGEGGSSSNTFTDGSSGASSSSIDIGNYFSLDNFNLIVGISMVLLNLFLDAYTNNEQDSIYKKYKISSFQMMKYINLWQVGYLVLYLICGAAMKSFLYDDVASSELALSIDMILRSAELRWDILIFCVCASLGQILIFEVMKDFGSLTWITISVTRKLFTILVSIVKFNHSVNIYQWMGIAAVFCGMGIEIVVKYFDGQSKKKKEKTE